MNLFVSLFAALDRTNKTNEKVAALESYFAQADPADAAWAIYLLSGQKVRQIIPIRKLCEWAAEAADTPSWLFEECYETVGDLAETVSLLLPSTERRSSESLSCWLEQRLIPLRELSEAEQRRAMLEYWSELSEQQCFLLHKLMTGAFRVGVSRRLVTRALASVAGLTNDVIAHRLMGDWSPTAEFYLRLVAPESDNSLPGTPYPFFWRNRWMDLRTILARSTSGWLSGNGTASELS